MPFICTSCILYCSTHGCLRWAGDLESGMIPSLLEERAGGGRAKRRVRADGWMQSMQSGADDGRSGKERTKGHMQRLMQQSAQTKLDTDGGGYKPEKKQSQKKEKDIPNTESEPAQLRKAASSMVVIIKGVIGHERTVESVVVGGGDKAGASQWNRCV
ncbi:uncharacterized protein BJ171DRAFT_180385 [Polychytrium aggregatum]|uniref:uncharacterized protein n=1 Tax=Polychytrium aggregatum TaxID=110093 RepID=UPI0022FF213E|nr:uncharacterized protein BJ171DRAFT_180385 [Polychytrium aggregatum]KAI9202445.1 hypothetical protein BJ171DRAFT_180385 [Polychytrium aggregatum]